MTRSFDVREMVEVLRALVEVESFTEDPEALGRCAKVIRGLCGDYLGSEPTAEGHHLVWRRPGDRPVLVLCHYDTVWPAGTIDGFPFEVERGVARGPGVFDMKAGIVQGLFALRASAAPATLLITADEERGSPDSRALIHREALRARAALVLEPAAPGGAVKVARKGVASWRVEVVGRAAHAGLEPERGVNAAEELAGVIGRVAALARPGEGTTVSVTMLGGGTAPNVVPERAWCRVDARMWTLEEAERLEAAVGDLRAERPGASLAVSGGLNRGPMERSASEALFRRLLDLGYDLEGAAVGGGSDGNFTAALGVPTLDGLGGTGGGAHARDEHVIVDEMPRRAEMVARLMDSLAADG